MSARESTPTSAIRTLTVGLAQINTVTGDIASNAKKVVRTLEHATDAGVDLVIFPELTLTGYPPRDLLDKEAFIDANLQALADVSAEATQVAAIIGHVEPNSEPGGKRLFNAASLIHSGTATTLCRKTLLPTYDVFDEARWFQPGAEQHPHRHGQWRLGVSICEDIWNNSLHWSPSLYDADPVQRLVERGAELLINISASPYSHGRRLIRSEMYAQTARHHRRPLIVVNAVGGNDTLIFDGGSCVFDGEGDLVVQAPFFEESFDIVNVDNLPEAVAPPEETIADVHRALVLGLRDYVRKCGFKKVLVGLSGGIDSAVTSALAVEALGPAAVGGVTMPAVHSSQGSVDDSAALAANLGIELLTIPIQPMVESFLDALEPVLGEGDLGVTAENIQARVRGVNPAALDRQQERDRRRLLHPLRRHGRRPRRHQRRPQDNGLRDRAPHQPPRGDHPPRRPREAPLGRAPPRPARHRLTPTLRHPRPDHAPPRRAAPRRRGDHRARLRRGHRQASRLPHRQGRVQAPPGPTRPPRHLQGLWRRMAYAHRHGEDGEVRLLFRGISAAILITLVTPCVANAQPTIFDIVGDSVSAGTNPELTVDHGWVDMLFGEGGGSLPPPKPETIFTLWPSIEVHNSAVSGSTAAQWAAPGSALLQTVLDHQPDLVVVMIGGNDFRAIVDQLQALPSQPDIILADYYDLFDGLSVNLPFPFTVYQGLSAGVIVGNQVIHDVGAEKGSPVVSIHDDFFHHCYGREFGDTEALDPPYVLLPIFNFNIHPVTAGHSAIYDEVFAELERVATGPSPSGLLLR
jgi:predicted amidohydrolase